MCMTTLTLPTSSQLSASDFIKSIKGLDRAKREIAAENALMAGNVPSYMRMFVDVNIVYTDDSGISHKLVVRTLPDYLTIGIDSDKLRMPLSPLTAQRIADSLDCLLPTTKLVTLFWNAALYKVPPQPWGPPYDASMMSTERYVAHDARINASMSKLSVDQSKLVAGHKKDVVMTNLLIDKPKQVAIFGWHQTGGRPIQPLYLGHENTYADYSHGIRLVARECIFDDVDDDLVRILTDPILCCGVSNEGVLRIVKQPS